MDECQALPYSNTRRAPGGTCEPIILAVMNCTRQDVAAHLEIETKP